MGGTWFSNVTTTTSTAWACTSLRRGDATSTRNVLTGLELLGLLTYNRVSCVEGFALSAGGPFLTVRRAGPALRRVHRTTGSSETNAAWADVRVAICRFVVRLFRAMVALAVCADARPLGLTGGDDRW